MIRSLRVALAAGVLTGVVGTADGAAQGRGPRGTGESSTDAMSVEAMLMEGRKIQAAMRAAREQAEDALRKARAANNVASMDCVNEALIAMKGIQRLGDDYVFAMEANAKQGNSKAVREGLGKIRIAGRKSEELSARAQGCGGPAGAGIVEGRPAVERVEDPDLPEGDPVDALDSEAIFVERPMTVSPYQ